MEGSDRHVILADQYGLHRITILEARHSGSHHVVLVPGDCLVMQLAALARLAGRVPTLPALPLYPTAAQRHRLCQLLRVLDAIEEVESPGPTLRRIAETILYPGRDLGRAIEWKCSSERRQTQRVLKHAIRMMECGFRSLHAGRCGMPYRGDCSDAISSWQGSGNP